MERRVGEREFSKAVRAALKSAGCSSYPVETGGTVVGFPDLVVLCEGGACFVELKCRPSLPLGRLDGAAEAGPGQRSFAGNVARRTAVMSDGFSVMERSFMLVECMDGVALLVMEGDAFYPAACWEALPSGVDLRDAMRAWRVGVVATQDLEGLPYMEAYGRAAERYGAATGIRFLLEGVNVPAKRLGGKSSAVAMSRDICDHGRIQLLMESMRKDKVGGRRLAPIEGGGFVIL